MATGSRHRFHLLFIAFFCLAGVARAQPGGTSVNMTGVVSGMVALSLPQGTLAPADGVLVTSSYNPDRSLTITFSGSTRGRTEVSIPVQLRSNSGYRLLASAKAGGASLSSILVVDARPTGNLVAAEAVEALAVTRIFDGRSGAGTSNVGGGLGRANLSSLVELLSGPRISLGGTPASPQNALKVVLSLTVDPRSDAQGWTFELLLSAAPVAGL